MKKANDVISSSLKSIQNATQAIGITMGANMAMSLARSFASSMQAALDQTDALGKLAERYGTTAEAMSVLQYQAKTSNVSVETLTTSMRQMAKAMVDGQNPASTQAQAFRAIGLSIDDLRRKDPAQAMADIAEAMSGFADGADKVAVARAIFGRAGDELIPMLNKGRQGFEDAKNEAEALGLVVSTQAAKAAAEFTTELTKLREAGDAMKRQLAAELLPSLQEVVSWMIESIQTGGSLITIIEAIGDAAALAAKAMIGAGGLVQAGKQWFNIMKGTTQIGKLSAEQLAENAKKNAEMTEELRRGLDATADAMANVTKRRDEFKRNRGQPEKDLGNEAADAGKKVLSFNDALNKAARAGRVAKAGVDEFAQMLKSLQEEFRRTQANGDEMALLLADPRLSKFSQDQVAQLTAQKQATLDLAQAQRAAVYELEQEVAQWEQGRAAYEERKKGLLDFANATKDALDPTRDYVRTVQRLVEANLAGHLSAGELGAAIDALKDKTFNAIDPMRKLADEMKDAMLGWGKQASDTFIDFISGAGDAKKSFGEMAASILRDIAKMLLYKNVIEPLFRGISGGFGGGMGGIFGGFFGSSADIGTGDTGALSFGGNRAVGGPTYPGQFYRVNESPFASEFFVPSAPGRIVRDGGGDTPMNVSITINTQTGGTDVEGDTAQAIELGKRMAMVARQVIATEKRNGGLLAS
ncbi:hypothetical protein AB4Y35_29040 [Paraburkholderia sp. EG286A]|uniref:hypothetical protein n=1 Tax=Paraburkholderia sp. EG286A TaxID=3237014 RepID=UPI0034D2294D